MPPRGLFILHITYLLVRLFSAGGHRVGFAQSGERPRPEVCDGRRVWAGRDGLFTQSSVPVAVRAQQTEGAGGHGVAPGQVLAQRFLWNTEEVHGEEDAPGQR